MVCSINLCTAQVGLDSGGTGLIPLMWSQKNLQLRTDIEANDGPLLDHVMKPAVREKSKYFIMYYFVTDNV